jgi:formylglycine-generating enzyme required for sulfatase activity
VFTVDSGFKNHPVTYVSWYGATAFCDYYGYRLPTECEWQAVADYDGSYTYGCGTAVNNNMANYAGSNHPYGTTPVGAFGTCGYGMADMAGNVWEWTSSTYPGDHFVLCGGSWPDKDSICNVLLGEDNRNNPPTITSPGYGFRVCR